MRRRRAAECAEHDEDVRRDSHRCGHRRSDPAMKSSESSQSVSLLGPLRLDPARGVLSRNGTPLAVGPRVVAILAALVERPGEVVTKDELLDRVWPDEDVG